MSVPPKSGSNTAIGAGLAQKRRRQSTPRLNAMLACDTAFRVIARRYLGDLAANHEATCKGDAEAVHQMRVALTHLRAAILFFSPMVADPQRAQIRDELKWLNGHLGAVRDLDVAIDRLQAIDKKQPQPAAYDRPWNEKRTASHRLLMRALRSARYRRLVKDTSDWIEKGPWSIKRGKQAAKERTAPIAEYSADKLAQWLQKLLKKSGGLLEMEAEKRHRLRLLNKRLTCSIEFLEDLFADRRFSRHQAALKYLRKAQRSLGQLNDYEKGRTLAAALQRDGVRAPSQFLRPKRQKRLLRTAAAAYRKLAELEK